MELDWRFVLIDQNSEAIDVKNGRFEDGAGREEDQTGI
jgi:hypothetical protein